MKTPPKKDIRPVCFVAQAELVLSLAREQLALAHESLRLIRKLQELNQLSMGAVEHVLATERPMGKLIQFPARALKSKLSARKGV